MSYTTATHTTTPATPTPPKPRSVLVLGRRWFERTNGNTYHTAEVLVDGVSVAVCLFAYGYGGQYLQSAEAELKRLGYMPGVKTYGNGCTEGAWQYFDRMGIHYSSEVIDVPRKKDLHNGGKR